MILADTSVWVDHLRTGDEDLAKLLANGQIVSHPFIIGELALGGLENRSVLRDLENLPSIVKATDLEVRTLIERQGLSGSGIGWVDAHLLASVLLTPGAALWTRDNRLASAAARLRVASDRAV